MLNEVDTDEQLRRADERYDHLQMECAALQRRLRLANDRIDALVNELADTEAYTSALNDARQRGGLLWQAVARLYQTAMPIHQKAAKRILPELERLDQ